jgi:hypothetical protein
MALLGSAVCRSWQHRLQSEEFVLRERALQLKYRKGADAEVVDPAKEIVRTENLPGGFGHGDES